MFTINERANRFSLHIDYSYFEYKNDEKKIHRDQVRKGNKKSQFPPSRNLPAFFKNELERRDVNKRFFLVQNVIMFHLKNAPISNFNQHIDIFCVFSHEM